MTNDVKYFDNTGAFLYPPAILILEGTEESVEKAKSEAIGFLNAVRESRLKAKRSTDV